MDTTGYQWIPVDADGYHTDSVLSYPEEQAVHGHCDVGTGMWPSHVTPKTLVRVPKRL